MAFLLDPLKIFKELSKSVFICLVFSLFSSSSSLLLDSLLTKTSLIYCFHRFSVLFQNLNDSDQYHCSLQIKTLIWSKTNRFLLLFKTLAEQKNFFLNWDSLQARLNSHYKAWSYKKKKQKMIKAYRKSL